MNNNPNPTNKKYKIQSSSRNSKTICRCKSCGLKFDYKERSKKAISFGMTRDVCPKCEGSFVVITYNHKEADKYLAYNPNLDSRMYVTPPIIDNNKRRKH